MKNTVRIIGADEKYHRAPVFIVPKLNKAKRVFIVGDKEYKAKFEVIRGTELMSCDEAPIHLTEETQIKMNHLDVFDLDNEQDVFKLQILKDSEMIAPSKYEVNPVEHRYFIEDLEADSKRTINKTKLIREAMNLIFNLTQEEMIDLAVILGRDLKHMTTNQIEAFLNEQALEDPQRLIGVLKEDEEYSYRVFLRKLVSQGIVTKSGEKHTYGSQLVGINEDYAIEFVKDNDNRTLVLQWAEDAVIKPPFTEVKKKVETTESKPRGTRTTKNTAK